MLIVKKRLMQQLPAFLLLLLLLLLLTALCGFNAAQEVHDDTGRFDRFLMAVTECKPSSTKLLRVGCIIEQVFSRPENKQNTCVSV